MDRRGYRRITDDFKVYRRGGIISSLDGPSRDTQKYLPETPLIPADSHAGLKYLINVTYSNEVIRRRLI